MLQKEVEHGMKRATIVKQISLTFLLHFKSSSTFFNINWPYYDCGKTIWVSMVELVPSKIKERLCGGHDNSLSN